MVIYLVRFEYRALFWIPLWRFCLGFGPVTTTNLPGGIGLLYDPWWLPYDPWNHSVLSLLFYSFKSSIPIYRILQVLRNDSSSCYPRKELDNNLLLGTYMVPSPPLWLFETNTDKLDYVKRKLAYCLWRIGFMTIRILEHNLSIW